MSLLKKKSISTLIVCGLLFSNVAPSFAISEFENGKDHIVGSSHDIPNESTSQSRVFASYEKNADFYLYNDTNINMYSSPSKSSRVIGTIAPQMLKASKRKGDWFLIDSYAGKCWVYQDSTVSLREVEDMHSNEFTTTSSLSLYSQPFYAFSKGQTLPVGTYPISKKAGDWFYINTEAYNGWFTTKSGKFNNSIATLNTNKINNTPLYVQLANYSNNVRPGNPMKPKYITIHNTANTSKGANAKAHANLLSNNNNGRTASWHFTIDDKSIYQSLPLNEIGYHAGDGSGPGNRSSIAIEICENSDGDFNKAQQNAAELTAKLLIDLDLPLSSVKNHKYFSGKDCPSKTFSSPTGWNGFISRVEKAYNSMSANIPAVTKDYYLDINSFSGEENVKNALNQLKNDTGWYAEYKPTGQYTTTVGRPIYNIETGGFIGEYNAKTAYELVQSSTGWYTECVPTGILPNEYKLVIGGFAGKDTAIDALNKLKNATGWYIETKYTGQYTNETEYTENIPLYRIITGGFGSKENAYYKSNFVKNNYGWYNEVKEQ